MTKEEKNNQTAKKAFQKYFTPYPGTNSALFRYCLLGKPSVEHKKIPEKKLTSREITKLLDKELSPLDEPIKSIDVEKPINGFDYLHALVRIPEVQKDLEAINKEPDNKEKVLELHNKYFGIFGFSPKLLLNPKDFYKGNKHFRCSSAIHVFSNWEKGSPDRLSAYRDGRHVMLAVDVTKKEQNIINEFRKLLNRIEKDYDIPKDTSRDKDTMVDIWRVYDYKTKAKLSVPEIARRLSGEKGNSAHNEALDRYVKRVKRAYSKAEEIINTVKREVAEAITKNAKRQKADNERKEMLNRMAEESRKKERTITIADQLLQGIPKKRKRK